MKKIVSFFSILVVLGILAWPFIQKQFVSLQEGNITDFRDIKVLKTDDKGTMYLAVDNGQDEEIIKVDKYGEVLKRTKVNPSKPEFDTEIHDLYIDNDENLFIMYCEFVPKDTGEFYAAITKLDNAWYSNRLVLRKKIGPVEQKGSFIFSGLSEDQERIFGGWVFGKKALVFRMPLSYESQVTMIYEYDLGSFQSIRETTVLPAGNIVFTDIEGCLYKGDVSGKIEKLYPIQEEQSIAVDLCYSGDGGVFFYDAYSDKYLKAVMDKGPQLIIDNNMSLNNEYGITLSDMKKITASPEGRFAAVVNNGEEYMLANGGFSYVSLIKNLHEKSGSKPLIIIFEIAAIVLLVTLLIWDFYCKVMKMRISIILKQCLGLLSAVLIIMMFMTTIFSDNLVRNVLYDEYRSHLADTSYIFANEILKQDVNSFDTPSDTVSEPYEHLRSIVNSNGLKELEGFSNYAKDMYFNIYKRKNDSTVFVFSSDNIPVSYPLDYTLLDSERESIINNTFKDKTVGFGIDSYSYGSWMYMTTPLSIGSQDFVVMETGLSMEDYELRYNTLKKTFSYVVLLIAALMLIIILSTIISSLISIRKLNKGVEQISAGHFDVRVNVKSGDEIEHLSNRFNDMASFIQNYTRKLALLNKSYYRFIPERFINMLGVKSIESVKKGDHLKEDMAVMNFKVRSFFELTSGMESEEIFKFINGVFERFSPVVQGFNGIIDRFMDTGFTAVFPDSPENSINAALRIQEKLSAWNIERMSDGLPKVNVGVTLHFGRVMLGVIGDGVRLSSAAVSQCLHTSARLEEYGNQSNVSTLSTGDIIKNLPPSVFKMRYIGTVKDSGAEIEIYDCFEGDEFSIRERKEQTLDSFNNGVMYFQQGDYFKARASFIEVLRVLPEDGVSKKYLYLSDMYYHDKDKGNKYYTL
ncbi:MAG: HAMP domain-containing protein [Acetivibrionales bacterium]|jgi:class 3 adenylate cyclase/HAMP domain-containing protein